LFVSSWGNRLDIGQVHRAFYAASRRIWLRGARDSHGPRLHDMRQNTELGKMPNDSVSTKGFAHLLIVGPALFYTFSSTLEAGRRHEHNRGFQVFQCN
jgi:hypothetical protein